MIDFSKENDFNELNENKMKKIIYFFSLKE